MLDVGIWEIAIIVVIAVLVLKPEDIPEVLHAVGKCLRKLKNMTHELTDALQDAGRDAGVSNIQYELKKITDMEGNEREAYDVSEIEELRRPVIPETELVSEVVRNPDDKKI